MRAVAHRQYEAFCAPPFTLFFHATDPLPFFNYAIPEASFAQAAPFENLAASLARLRAEFAARRRVPRFEFVEACAPDLSAALETHGFILENRAQLMVCPRGSERVAPAVAGLDVEALDARTSLEKLALFLDVQRRAFRLPSPRPATREEARSLCDSLGNGFALMGRIGGRPVATAMIQPGEDGLAELVGVATLEEFRRRGIGGALSFEAVLRAFGSSLSLVFLSAADAGAGRVYEAAGFSAAGHSLFYTAERMTMPKSRREFLTITAASAAALVTGAHADAQTPPSASTPAAGTPPAFGTAPAVGPEISPATIAEAEKLVRVTLTPKDRAQAAGNWRESLAGTMERRTGPKKVVLEPSLAPASQWNPVLPGLTAGPARDRFERGAADPGPLPKRDDDIAFAPVTALSRWVESKALTSERLTRIYLDRLRRFDPQIKCVITLTPELALEQARRADAEIAAGKYRGPLHGIPWGVKDLLDTKGIRTTWGAEPFQNRVPDADATVVKRLHDAGAVLVAKLSLGAFALNDVWFGGETKNPWALEEGSGGSSAGPASATAAGLVGFSIGSETEGSIVGPSMRCGVTGLRPTFGRVARTGAMTLSWSMDKLGPITRGVEDTLLVLAAISGPDAGDVSSVPSRLDFEGNRPVSGLEVGFFPAWMKEATGVDRAALETAKRLGMVPVEVSLPDWPYGSLNTILFAEAAAAFEELTLSGGLDQLKMQVPDAWPNTFRQSRFLSAVDYVQADRLRRKVAQEMARIFENVDLLLVPSLRDEILTITNFTGHPSLTLPAGFVEIDQARSDWAPDPARPLPKFSPKRRVPHGVTLIGRLFDEGTIGRAGIALERAFGVRGERPKGF